MVTVPSQSLSAFDFDLLDQSLTMPFNNMPISFKNLLSPGLNISAEISNLSFHVCRSTLATLVHVGTVFSRPPPAISVPDACKISRAPNEDLSDMCDAGVQSSTPFGLAAYLIENRSGFCLEYAQVGADVNHIIYPAGWLTSGDDSSDDVSYACLQSFVWLDVRPERASMVNLPCFGSVHSKTSDHFSPRSIHDEVSARPSVVRRIQLRGCNSLIWSDPLSIEEPGLYPCKLCIDTSSLHPNVRDLYRCIDAPLLSSLLWVHIQPRGINTFVTLLPSHSMFNRLARPVGVGLKLTQSGGEAADSMTEPISIATMDANSSLALPVVYPDELPVLSASHSLSKRVAVRPIRTSYQVVIYVRTVEPQGATRRPQSSLMAQFDAHSGCMAPNDSSVVFGTWAGAFPIVLHPSSMTSNLDEAWLVTASPPDGFGDVFYAWCHQNCPVSLFPSQVAFKSPLNMQFEAGWQSGAPAQAPEAIPASVHYKSNSLSTGLQAMGPVCLSLRPPVLFQNNTSVAIRVLSLPGGPSGPYGEAVLRSIRGTELLDTHGTLMAPGHRTVWLHVNPQDALWVMLTVQTGTQRWSDPFTVQLASLDAVSQAACVTLTNEMLGSKKVELDHLQLHVVNERVLAAPLSLKNMTISGRSDVNATTDLGQLSAFFSLSTDRQALTAVNPTVLLSVAAPVVVHNWSDTPLSLRLLRDNVPLPNRMVDLGAHRVLSPSTAYTQAVFWPLHDAVVGAASPSHALTPGQGNSGYALSLGIGSISIPSDVGPALVSATPTKRGLWSRLIGSASNTTGRFQWAQRDASGLLWSESIPLLRSLVAGVATNAPQLLDVDMVVPDIALSSSGRRAHRLHRLVVSLGRVPVSQLPRLAPVSELLPSAAAESETWLPAELSDQVAVLTQGSLKSSAFYHEASAIPVPPVNSAYAPLPAGQVGDEPTSLLVTVKPRYVVHNRCTATVRIRQRTRAARHAADLLVDASTEIL